MLFVLMLTLFIAVFAQKPKKHYGHTVTTTLHGAKFGPAGAATGFVVGRVLDKRKDRREREGKQSFVRKHMPLLKRKR